MTITWDVFAHNKRLARWGYGNVLDDTTYCFVFCRAWLAFSDIPYSIPAH